MGHIQTVEDLILFLKRALRLVLTVFVLGTAIAVYFGKTRPRHYEAVAAIQVQGAQIAHEESGGNSVEILQNIEHRLTRRQAMLDLIDRHDLYRDLPALTEEEKVALLRESISFHGIEARGAQYGRAAEISAILVIASDSEAKRSAEIANDLAQSILDLSASGQMEAARTTYQFYLEEQISLTAQLGLLDGEIAEFKNANAGALPEVVEANRDALVALDADIRAIDQQLVADAEEQRQIRTNATLRATAERRLQELTAHASVLQEQRNALSQRRAEVTEGMEKRPEVERALATFERDRSLLQARLDSAARHVADAETAMRLAERQQGERFALLDRAVTPPYPKGGSAKKIVIAGALASLMLGLALAFLRDMLRPVLRTSSQVERQMGLRPVLAIPEFRFETSSQDRLKKAP